MEKVSKTEDSNETTLPSQRFEYYIAQDELHAKVNKDVSDKLSIIERLSGYSDAEMVKMQRNAIYTKTLEIAEKDYKIKSLNRNLEYLTNQIKSLKIQMLQCDAQLQTKQK